MPGPPRFYHVLSDPNADTDTYTEANANTVEVADAVSFRLWLFDGHHEPERQTEPDPGITLAQVRLSPRGRLAVRLTSVPPLRGRARRQAQPRGSPSRSGSPSGPQGRRAHRQGLRPDRTTLHGRRGRRREPDHNHNHNKPEPDRNYKSDRYPSRAQAPSPAAPAQPNCA